MQNKRVVEVSHKENKEEIERYHKELFIKNNEIYLLAGELNPKYYKPLAEKYYSFIKDKDINVICGPYISVEDELFRKYHDIDKNHLGNWWYAKKKGEWWKVHPVFEIAHKENNINLYIIKHRYEPHFSIGVDTNDVLVEAPHKELDEGRAKIHYDDEDLAHQYLEKWHEIKDKKCYKWDWENDEVIFKPIYKIKRELKLEKKIEKVFSELKVFQNG